MRGLERPTPLELPADTSREDFDAACARYEEQTLVCAYKHLLKTTSVPAFNALMYDESVSLDVLSASRRLFETAEMYCLGEIEDMGHSSLRFEPEDLAKIELGLEQTMASIRVMDVIKEGVGDLFPEKGLVRLEQYDEAKRQLHSIKAQVLDDFAQSSHDRQVFAEAWPFDD